MSKLLSVMVWIHGGTFFEGTGNYEQFGPEYLIRKGNVIIVTLNYRLGIYGKRFMFSFLLNRSLSLSFSLIRV